MFHYVKNRSVIFLFLGISFLLYLLYYLTTKDLAHIMDSFILKLAFLPIYVLCTSMFLDQLLSIREQQLTKRKKNMIIGVFYTEIGQQLLTILSGYCNNLHEFNEKLIISQEWDNEYFQKAKNLVNSADFSIQINCGLDSLLQFLKSKRLIMIELLQNPNLLEDESFTDLILAASHLSEELIHRSSLGTLSEMDYNHLANDIKRAYKPLIIEWLKYLQHLKKNYPYLYSLQVMVNPFEGSLINPDECRLS